MFKKTAEMDDILKKIAKKYNPGIKKIPKLVIIKGAACGSTFLHGWMGGHTIVYE